MTTLANATTLAEERERVSLGKSSDEALAAGPLEPRYRELAILGEGGMGEVRLVRDAVIGRDVALKRVRGAIDQGEYARERFLREARVQGQLEHPSIVPVYDLAMTPDRRLFFTMHRVHGRAFDEIAASAMSRHAILSAMSRVCLAVDFAHSRGVVHRDIKPGNLMIGDFGEVYVLDWGLAKLLGAALDPAHPSGAGGSVDGDGSQHTTIGSVLGTPGFMPPEQARGEDVDARADVYALGACLFELLAGKPLFEIGSVQSMVAATLAGANARIRERAPERDVAVELEAICVRATQTNREDRFASARAMSEAIERFLEGDRDLERRRARAREHASAALALLERAHAEERARKDAMREVGFALANDPDDVDARRALVRLLTDPPRETPAEVEREMIDARARLMQGARPYAAIAFLATLVPTAVVAWAGVRDFALLAVEVATAIVGAALVMVPPRFMVRARRFVVAAVAAAGLVPAARIAGPLVVVPVLAMGLAAGLTLFPRTTRWQAVVGIAMVCVALPFVLQWAGVMPHTLHIEHDRIVIDADFTSFAPVPTIVWFFFATLMPIAATCLYLARVRDRLVAAERRIRLQAWQLRQILPAA